MAVPTLTLTEDGFESQIGTNHFGHFALTLGLIPALKAGVKALGKNSRIVNLSSCAHMYDDVHLDDINYSYREYQPWTAYGQSKTANILFSISLTKRYAKDGIYANAVMPGCTMTGLQKHVPEEVQKGWLDEANSKLPLKFKTVEQGKIATTNF